MLADFFTKPLQGSLFRKFRAVIMGDEHVDSLKATKPTPSQERVGEDTKIGNGFDGRKTDVTVSEPQTKMSYADVVGRAPLRSANIKETVIKRLSDLQSVTFKK